MNKSIQVFTSFQAQRDAERARWRAMSPEERLDEVELLRIEAGKLLYAYPTRLRRVVAVTRRK
ncbi:MAG: hypothetical protein GF418_09875 [Chitinivibrionales bacterium]|nr:hypothetical protein [Chitinivibrionales bacterium]MBD3395919.1 hypothetical protein [Chitinivibrionales bacterium]